jgi:outer membrane protein assembly factor BamB
LRRRGAGGSAACEPKQLLTLPNRAVFTWEDDSGHLIYGDYSREGQNAHLHALDAQGKDRWNVELESRSVSNLALGAQHQLIVGSSTSNGKILCLTD